jgi:hypothetical protein
MPCTGRAAGRAGSNTQHDDSAIDYLRLPDSRARPQADDASKIKHVLSKGLHATRVWESVLADLFCIFTLPLTSTESTLTLSP